MNYLLRKIKSSPVIRFRVFLFAFLLIFLLFLAVARIVPGGHITYQRDFSRPTYLLGGRGFIGHFSPAERVDLKSTDFPRVIADPLYFSLFTPRAFDKAYLTIKYRDNLASSTPIIEAGVLMDRLVWQYQMQPVENKILDSLDWSMLREGSISLYQRSDEYNNLSDFLNEAGLHEDLALYNYNLKPVLKIDNYQVSDKIASISPVLRGAYQFYVYLGDEDLNFTFFFKDINQNYDLRGDDIKIIITDTNGQEIISKDIADDGVIIDSGQETIHEPASFVVKDLPVGMYKIEVRANDDIISNKILSLQTEIFFINKLWLVDNSVESLDLYTNADNLRATAFGARGQQRVLFANQYLDVSAPFEQFYAKASANVSKDYYRINVLPDNIILENNGLFSFSDRLFLNPDFPKIDGDWRDDGQTNFILSDYQAPQEEDGLKTAVLEFNLKDAYREDKKYNFILSVPGLYAVNKNKAYLNEDLAYLEIQEISIELSGKSLFTKVKEILF